MSAICDHTVLEAIDHPECAGCAALVVSSSANIIREIGRERERTIRAIDSGVANGVAPPLADVYDGADRLVQYLARCRRARRY